MKIEVPETVGKYSSGVDLWNNSRLAFNVYNKQNISHGDLCLANLERIPANVP